MSEQTRAVYNKIMQLGKIAAECERRATEMLEELPLETVAEIYIHATKPARKARAKRSGR